MNISLNTTKYRNLVDVFLPYVLLFVFLSVNVYLFWPGQMFPDSVMQYNAALTGSYGDHHPPMMSVLWKLLDFVYKGPGLLFLFHLLLLYSATALFITIFCSSRLKWLYLFLPLVPPISLYSSMIWKDAGFAFSYLFVAAVLSYFIVNQKRPNIFISGLVLLVLFYGTGVKFQAIYILPVMLFGFCYVLNQFRINKRTIFLTIFMYAGFFGSLTAFNNYFVPPENKSHSWQMVKLYDLAAISLDTNAVLFPAFIQQSPIFSVEKMKEKFNYERVDDLVWGEQPPLKIGSTPEERQLIFDTWVAAVLHHPVIYLKHRFLLSWTMLNNYPIKKLATLDFSHYEGLKWLSQSQKSDGINKLIFTVLRVVRYPLKSIFLIPFILLYLFLGFWSLAKKPEYAMPLIILSSAGLLLLFVLFFFSMASTIRYVYFTVCMFHASHGFAYMCFKQRKLL